MILWGLFGKLMKIKTTSIHDWGRGERERDFCISKRTRKSSSEIKNFSAT
jgi:hypothetical protein